MRLVEKDVWLVVVESSTIATVEKEDETIYIEPTRIKDDSEYEKFEEIMEIVKFVVKELFEENHLETTDKGCNDPEAVHVIGGSGTIYHVCLSDYPRVFVEPE